MRTKSSRICLVFVALVLPGHIIALQIGYVPELYVVWNKIIVEGVIISDVAVEPQPWVSGVSGLFPTNRGTIVVERVLRRSSDYFVSRGDTVRFRYPTSNFTVPRDDGSITFAMEICDFENLEVGRAGLFSFRLHKEHGLVPGYSFLTTDTQREEVLELLAEVAADSAGTMAKIKERSPFRLLIDKQ